MYPSDTTRRFIFSLVLLDRSSRLRRWAFPQRPLSPSLGYCVRCHLVLSSSGVCGEKGPLAIGKATLLLQTRQSWIDLLMSPCSRSNHTSSQRREWTSRWQPTGPLFLLATPTTANYYVLGPIMESAGTQHWQKNIS